MSEPDRGSAPPKKKSLNLNIDEQTRRGVYANKAVVAHSRDEFILDFVSDLPPAAQIVSRVVTAPAHAKALAQTLMDNVERYERKHGEIPTARREPPGNVADA
jgi:hypothetical protein